MRGTVCVRNPMKHLTITQTPDEQTPPLNRDYNRDPNIWALKRRGFMNHGSTLGI